MYEQDHPATFHEALSESFEQCAPDCPVLQGIPYPAALAEHTTEATRLAGSVSRQPAPGPTGPARDRLRRCIQQRRRSRESEGRTCLPRSAVICLTAPRKETRSDIGARFTPRRREIRAGQYIIEFDETPEKCESERQRRCDANTSRRSRRSVCRILWVGVRCPGGCARWPPRRGCWKRRANYA